MWQSINSSVSVLSTVLVEALSSHGNPSIAGYGVRGINSVHFCVMPKIKSNWDVSCMDMKYVLTIMYVQEVLTYFIQ